MPATVIQSHIDALRRQIESAKAYADAPRQEWECREALIHIWDRLNESINELELLEAAVSKEAKK